MNRKQIEEKVIEIYEQVAIGVITPNQAREKFMVLFQSEREKIIEEFREMIGEDESERNLCQLGCCEEIPIKVRNELRKQLRAKLEGMGKEEK